MTLREELQKTCMEKDIFSDIIGQEHVKTQILSALLMGRSIILVGPPGCGKTTFAKSIAKSLTNHTFVRVQGSPDLTAEDLLGDIDPIKALEYGPLSKEAFVPGKIFKADKGVLFFDEVNRCPQKIQNALLQVLQEKFATIGSYDVDFPADFIFIGTMNPEDTSTEKLSHVFMDRFDMIYVSYPRTLEEELDILEKDAIKSVSFDNVLLDKMVSFVRNLRTNEKLSKVPSVRATIGLYERSQSNAILEKRDSVTARDIFRAVKSVLAHRIELKPSIKYLTTAEDFVEKEFSIFAKKEALDLPSSDEVSG